MCFSRVCCCYVYVRAVMTCTYAYVCTNLHVSQCWLVRDRHLRSAGRLLRRVRRGVDVFVDRVVRRYQKVMAEVLDKQKNGA
jgi:hypothetical protein